MLEWHATPGFICSNETDFYDGLYIPYLNNFISMLQIARANNIYLFVTLGYVPLNNYYTMGLTDNPDIQGENAWYMNPSFLQAKESYVATFMNYIKATDSTLLPVIIDVELQDEPFVDASQTPFTYDDRSVQTADWNCDMTSYADRQQCVDDNFVNWGNQMIAALHSADPDAMGSISVFPFNQIGLPNGGNGVHPIPNYPPHQPPRAVTLAINNMPYPNLLSFVDIHIYPQAGAPYALPGSYSIDADWNSMEFSNFAYQYKAIWLGEFGAGVGAYANPSNDASNHAANGMQYTKNYLVSRGIVAWGYWTYDNTYNPETWSAAGNNIYVFLAPRLWGF
jgi:hypothetical protein